MQARTHQWLRETVGGRRRRGRRRLRRRVEGDLVGWHRMMRERAGMLRRKRGREQIHVRS
jgi:hypothetical protein